MASLPSATTRLQDQSGSAPVSTDLVAILAPCRLNADFVPRFYSSLADLITAHDYCEGAEYAALHMRDTKKPVLFVPLAIVTDGALVRSESVHTGTSKVTVAVGSDGALAEVDADVIVVRGGTVGTDEIGLKYSLDGGTSYKTARVGTASTFAIPNIAATITLGAGTLVAGDTILAFKTSAPLGDAAGLASAKDALIVQQKACRSWVIVGDCATLVEAQGAEDAVNAYETEAERHVYAKVQARDARSLESSRLRHAMVGGSAVTFAEVGGTGDTITRGTGSFVTDGFAVGDWVTVTGSASNNVSGKVTTVTATVLTFDTTDLANEGPTAVDAVRITGEASFIFATPGQTITRNTGSWTAEGFKLGDTVTIAGSASNDGTAVITTITSTVITCSAEAFVAETVGSCTCSVTLTESNTAWKTAIDGEFASIDSSERLDIGAGRLAKISPITGFKMRRPVQWADSIRSYQHDVRTTTWWKDLGALDGWDITGEHDERVNGGLLASRFTCARTWGNDGGAYIAMSVTRADADSILSMTHNVAITNVARTVCQRTTENFAGAVLVLNPADTLGVRTATKGSLVDLEAKVNSELQRNLLSNVGGEGQRASRAVWSAATDDDLGVADATLHGTLDLELNGTIVHIATVVGVK